MIQEIIKLLPLIEYGRSETIDRAKGSKQLPKTFKQLRKFIKNGNYKIC